MSQAQRAVVTGATSGIGEAIARQLAAFGLTVVLVGRSDQRLDQARLWILAAVPDADLRIECADLSLLGDVHKLAQRLSGEPAPNVVISNAAIIAAVDDTTSEGIQRTLATNYLAPYVLLRSLVAPIGSRPARFVVVGASPSALARVPVDLDDLESPVGRGLARLPSVRPFSVYGRTKNMNAMFVYGLARRLGGRRITVNGAHPGIVNGTGLGTGSRGTLRIFSTLMSPFLPGPATGADTPVWLATAPEVDGVNGRFFVHRTQVPTAPHTVDIARCDQLWDQSARLVGLPATL